MVIISSIRPICDTARHEHAGRRKTIFCIQWENAINDLTFLSERDLNDEFQAEALKNEDTARQRFKLRPGRYQSVAAERGALQAAIDLIGDGKVNRDGFLKLMMAGAPELTLEALLVKYAERYGAQFPHLFPEQTLRIARQQLDWPQPA